MIKPAEIQVRFSDLDVMGHVNNSIYLSYFEYTRVHYFGQLLGVDWDWNKNGVLLAKNEVEYLKPVFLSDVPVISMFTETIGTKSFTLSYEVNVNNGLTTKGISTLVCYDATENKTIEIPELLKQVLLKLKKV